MFFNKSRGVIFCITLCLLALCLAQGWAEYANGRLKIEDYAPEGKPIYTLVDCINIALRKNPDVQVSLKKIEEAEGLKIEARAGFLPSLTSSATYLHREEDYATQDGSNPLRRQEDWNINFRITQNLYSGGKNTSQFAISKFKKEQALLEYRAVVEEMVMNVRMAFYEVLLNEASIKVQKQAVEMLKQELEDQKARQHAGTVPKLNVLRAEVNLANETPALIEAENNYKNALLKLSELMAIPFPPEDGEVPFSVQGNLDYQKVDISLNDCLAKAEATRPELKAKELQIQIEEKQVIVDRSNIIPKIDLFVGYDQLNETSSAAKNDTVGGYVAGISGTWHAFDGLETMGKMKATRARLASAYMARDAERISIQTEVRSAFLKLRQAETTLASQAENSVLARESFLLSKASFDAGFSTQLDTIQSRVDLTRAQTNELKARFNHKIALARLQRSISSEFRIVDDTAASRSESLSNQIDDSLDDVLETTSPTPEKKAPEKPVAKPAFRVSLFKANPQLRHKRRSISLLSESNTLIENEKIDFKNSRPWSLRKQTYAPRKRRLSRTRLSDSQQPSSTAVSESTLKPNLAYISETDDY